MIIIEEFKPFTQISLSIKNIMLSPWVVALKHITYAIPNLIISSASF
jgi:hypothetical protein